MLQLATQCSRKVCDLEFPFACCIQHSYPDLDSLRHLEQSTFKVFVHSNEPSALKISENDLLELSNNYDLILTNSRAICGQKNIRHFVFGTSWITDSSPPSPPYDKEYSVSFLYSPGIGGHFTGYIDRKELWNRKKEILMPQRFYTSSRLRTHLQIHDPNPYPFDSKANLMNSMYTIVIENSYETSYFTEKLLDALVSYTIPIYIGAPDIASYFSKSSILVAQSVQDVINIANSLTESTYESLSQAVFFNSMIGKHYADYKTRIQLAITKAYYLSLTVD